MKNVGALPAVVKQNIHIKSEAAVGTLCRSLAAAAAAVASLGHFVNDADISAISVFSAYFSLYNDVHEL